MTSLHKPITRRTNEALSGAFGPDRGRELVITLLPNGVIQLRPLRTRRAESVAIADVYAYALRCRVNAEHLARARERKAKHAERLARARQARAEKRLFEH